MDAPLTLVVSLRLRQTVQVGPYQPGTLVRCPNMGGAGCRILGRGGSRTTFRPVRSATRVAMFAMVDFDGTKGLAGVFPLACCFRRTMETKSSCRISMRRGSPSARERLAMAVFNSSSVANEVLPLAWNSLIGSLFLANCRRLYTPLRLAVRGNKPSHLKRLLQ